MNFVDGVAAKQITTKKAVDMDSKTIIYGLHHLAISNSVVSIQCRFEAGASVVPVVLAYVSPRKGGGQNKNDFLPNDFAKASCKTTNLSKL